MTLHPILAEKLSSALAPAPRFALTRRDARLPTVPGKVHAVIGMRRAGKTTFLRQLLGELRALRAGAREHPRAARRVLVLDRDALARIDAHDAEVRPAYEWLLAPPGED
jgi:hypothetical protein